MDTKAWRIANRDRINAARRAAYRSPLAQEREVICRVCGHTFIAEPGRARWVCYPCQGQAWLARAEVRRRTYIARVDRERERRGRRSLAERGGSFDSKRDAAALFERDGWICQLCRQPVDPSFRYPDTRSASLDHIISILEGGPHEASNLQLAHLGCNIRRGTKAAA